MLEQAQFDRILKIFLPLQQASRQILQEFQQTAYFARIPAGRDVFAPGDHVDSIAIVISGAVRVYKIGNTGREITLYRFSSGESCILTATAILNNDHFPAIASAEQETEAILIPADTFRAWVIQHALWREFVFDLLSQRLLSVMEIVDVVAFGRMDSRVANLLLERAHRQNPIPITHQEIADELGSSREVISRILGGFASQNFIQLNRGTVEILDFDGIKSYIAV